jgi:hypothetical protein
MGQSMMASRGLGIAGALDRVVAAYQAALPEARTTITSQLRSLGVDVNSVELGERTQSLLASQVTLEVQTTIQGGFVSYEMRVPFEQGRIVLTDGVIRGAFNDAKTAFLAQPSKDDMTPIPSMLIDLSKIVAEHVGDLVLYKTEELPTWQFHAAVGSLANQANHSVIASHILASIRGNCLADWSRVAAFKQKDFSLPMVREVAVKASISEVPGFRPADFTPAAIEERATGLQMVATGMIQPPVNPTEKVEADNRRYAFEGRLRSTVESAVLKHVAAQFKGEFTKIGVVDLSGARERVNGLPAGKAVVSVSFYADNSLQETSLDVPFSQEGIVEAEKIVKAPAALAAEVARNEEMRILSEEQAKTEFKTYMDQQKLKAELLVQAGTAPGANTQSLGAVARVPILKALLPAETKPGDKFELRGYVYEVAETSFQSSDVSHSAYFMLCLTPDLPGKAAQLNYWA